MRGRAGANGGTGVITKYSVKLSPWHADSPTTYEMEREPGEALSTGRLTSAPDNYHAVVLTFPTTEHDDESLGGNRPNGTCLHYRAQLYFIRIQ